MRLCLQGSFHHERREVGPRYSGLPNIAGFADGVFNFQTTSGALSHDNLGDHSQEVRAMTGYHKINLDASLSSDIYGASDTVQPAGIFAQCLIRYA